MTAPTDTKLSSYIGVLIIVLFAMIVAAILFVPKAQGVTDAVVQQILTAMVGVVGVYVGWQYGSSQGSQRKDETIAAQAAPPAVAPVTSVSIVPTP